MTKAIGIDLGTTNSVVGIKKLETDIISNAEGDDLTPSVVGFQKKKGIVRIKSIHRRSSRSRLDAAGPGKHDCFRQTIDGTPF